jgi:hypothetical protein
MISNRLRLRAGKLSALLPVMVLTRPGYCLLFASSFFAVVAAGVLGHRGQPAASAESHREMAGAVAGEGLGLAWPRPAINFSKNWTVEALNSPSGTATSALKTSG